mmetsp:Transcript_97484/g.232032  ORF Transcript_97484/g.232032 Transcript_97484/m.232032 type:complete len:225 (-) Transcript_97484:1513-2187(-)
MMQTPCVSLQSTQKFSSGTSLSRSAVLALWSIFTLKTCTLQSSLGDSRKGSGEMVQGISSASQSISTGTKPGGGKHTIRGSSSSSSCRKWSKRFLADLVSTSFPSRRSACSVRVCASCVSWVRRAKAISSGQSSTTVERCTCQPSMSSRSTFSSSDVSFSSIRFRFASGPLAFCFTSFFHGSFSRHFSNCLNSLLMTALVFCSWTASLPVLSGSRKSSSGGGSS